MPKRSASGVYIIRLLLCIVLLTNCNVKNNEMRLCRGFDAERYGKEQVNVEDGKKILDLSIRKYRTLKKYSANISTKKITMGTHSDFLSASYYAEQSDQEMKISYSAAENTHLDWTTYNTQKINCEEFLLKGTSCKEIGEVLGNREWCDFIREEVFDKKTQTIKASGTIEGDAKTVKIDHTNSSGPNTTDIKEDLADGINWLDRISGAESQITRLVVKDSVFAILDSENLKEIKLVGTDTCDKGNCYVITAKFLNQLTEDEKDPFAGLLLTFWISKNDSLIRRLEIKTVTDKVTLLSVEEHHNISFE